MSENPYEAPKQGPEVLRPSKNHLTSAASGIAWILSGAFWLFACLLVRHGVELIPFDWEWKSTANLWMAAGIVFAFFGTIFLALPVLHRRRSGALIQSLGYGTAAPLLVATSLGLVVAINPTYSNPLNRPAFVVIGLVVVAIGLTLASLTRVLSRTTSPREPQTADPS